MAYMRLSRAILYSTPGIDASRGTANGFNQVTPRFLEGVACGCHILARYTDNPGTRFCEVSKFEFHGTTAVFCELEANPYSWVYQSSRRHASHRIICTGNFSPTNNAAGRLTGTVEFTDEIGKDEILAQLGQMPFHPRYIAHHFSRYTYPVQKKDTRDVVAAVKRKLQPLGVRLVGRIAEWEYFNMDAAMGSALSSAHD